LKKYINIKNYIYLILIIIMVVNKRGGKKGKRGKGITEEQFLESHNYTNKEDGQQYGKVEKLLGNCRVLIISEEHENFIGMIRGSIRKRVRLTPGDYILYGEREFEKEGNKVDIIWKFTSRQVKDMISSGKLTEIKTNVDKTVMPFNEDNDVFFEEENEEENVFKEDPLKYMNNSDDELDIDNI